MAPTTTRQHDRPMSTRKRAFTRSRRFGLSRIGGSNTSPANNS